MLKFTSLYPSKLWVTIMWYTPNCPDGGNWSKKGWWSLVPGQSKIVSGSDLADVNRYWCFYAQAANGAIWAGPYKRLVPAQAFDLCEWTSSTGAFKIGYRLLDVDDNDDLTVNLVP
jgi:uncharacterized membrane protein